MFMKFGNEDWISYSNCNMIESVEIVKADGKSPSYVVMVHYISGRVVEVYSSVHMDECQDFADEIMSRELSLAFSPLEAI